MPVHATSEMGRPRPVERHAARPGLLVVALDTRDGLRCDDVFGPAPARREHRWGVSVLQRFARRCFARNEALG